VSGGAKLDPISWRPHDLKNGMNIWSADLSAFKLDSVPGLRVDGRRVSPGETETRGSGGSLEPPGPLLTHTDSRLYGAF
jgi:hypothetical protein